MNSYYTQNELSNIGFKSFGENVFISNKTSIYSPQDISIGDNVRIDDFCILSGKINMGNHIHIASYSGLFAGNVGITLNNFSGLSGRVLVYAISDDYSGKSLVGPTIPDKYRKINSKEVIIHSHCHVGAGSILLPGSILKEGACLGSMSMVSNRKLSEWSFYFGIPAKKVSERDKIISQGLAIKLINEEKINTKIK